jgi:hypothetical protein
MPCRTPRQRLEPELDEPAPEAPAPEAPALLPEEPDAPAPLAPPLSLLAPVPEALPEAPPQSFCAHFASPGLRPAHPAFAEFVRDLPEFVGVPAELMCCE